MKHATMLLVLLCVGLMMCAGCEKKSQTGALVGGAAGAGAGALIGHAAGSTGVGAVIGGAAGAGGGYLIGKKMEEKDQETYAPATDANTVTIDVPRANGGVNPVVLKRQGSVWVGPNGETYEAIPTADQLRQRYGY